MTTVVLVHGAFHDGWCWELVRLELDRRGVPNQALDLPFTGLEGDAEAVGKLLDAIDGPAVLCGHSYGGMVISRAASGRHDVAHLVYLCAVQVGEDVDLATAMTTSDELMSALVAGDDGSMSVNPAVAPAVFYHDCSDELTETAVGHLRGMGFGVIQDSGEPPPPAAWKQIESTYVVCSDDQTIAPESQRKMATNATHVVEWDTSHSPMLSRPELVADLLADLAAEATKAKATKAKATKAKATKAKATKGGVS
jgi:pimeloyl-ACP methyl ester carboxylesterase